MSDLNDIFEEYGRLPEDTPEEQARLEKRRRQLRQREIERGIRDADGDLVYHDDPENDEEEEDDQG